MIFFFLLHAFRRCDSRYFWNVRRSYASWKIQLRQSIGVSRIRFVSFVYVVTVVLVFVRSELKFKAVGRRHVCPFRISTGRNESTNCAYGPFEMDCEATPMCKYPPGSMIYITRFGSKKTKKTFCRGMMTDLSCDPIRFFADELCESGQRFCRVSCGGELRARLVH